MKPEEIKEKFDSLEAQIKQSNRGFISAIRTFFIEFKDYLKSKNKKEFPTDAAIGVANAFLYRKIGIIIGSIGGLILAVLQIWFLYNQNKILDTQTQLLEAQKDSDRIVVLSGLMNMIDSKKPFHTNLALEELRQMDSTGFTKVLDLYENELELDQRIVFKYLRRKYFDLTITEKKKLRDFIYSVKDRSLSKISANDLVWLAEYIYHDDLLDSSYLYSDHIKDYLFHYLNNEGYLKADNLYVLGRDDFTLRLEILLFSNASELGFFFMADKPNPTFYDSQLNGTTFGEFIYNYCQQNDINSKDEITELITEYIYCTKGKVSWKRDIRISY